MDVTCKDKRNKGMWNELRKGLEALLEINDRDLFKDLRNLQTRNVARQNPRSVPKEKEKLKAPIVKRTFLRMNSPAFAAPGLVRHVYQSEVRRSEVRCGCIQWSG